MWFPGMPWGSLSVHLSTSSVIFIECHQMGNWWRGDETYHKTTHQVTWQEMLILLRSTVNSWTMWDQGQWKSTYNWLPQNLDVLGFHRGFVPRHPADVKIHGCSSTPYKMAWINTYIWFSKSTPQTLNHNSKQYRYLLRNICVQVNLHSWNPYCSRVNYIS